MTRKDIFFLTGLIILSTGVILLSIIDRSDSPQMIIGLLLGFFGLIISFQNKTILTQRNLFLIFGLGILLRVFFTFDAPRFSDDFYRFLWDGRATTLGLNPFDKTPEEVCKDTSIRNIQLCEEQYGLDLETIPRGKLNSEDVYTIYPPVNQCVYALSSSIGKEKSMKTVVAMKWIMLIFEILTFFLLKSLIAFTGKQNRTILLYWLNPIVIMELAGNLHFEGVAITFILATLYFLRRQNYLVASIPLALAFCTKLTPAILGLVALKRMSLKKWLLWGVVSGVLAVILFSLFLNSENVGNFFASMKLYTRRFEFNASIYYVLLKLQKMLPEANIVGLYSYWLPLILATAVLSVNFVRRNYTLTERFFLALFLYFVFSKVVHPWYITPLIALTPLVRWNFAILWSGMIGFTYLSYGGQAFEEQYWISFLSYAILFVFAYLEIKKKRTQETNKENSIL